MLTTGGGWQDQVNGLYPGIKQGRSSKSETDMHVQVRQIELADDFTAELGRHMLLVFTGKVRLAKNLLRVYTNPSYRVTHQVGDYILLIMIWEFYHVPNIPTWHANSAGQDLQLP